jgi:ParB family transcriptional regulator, chromosome partitioning protein
MITIGKRNGASAVHAHAAPPPTGSLPSQGDLLELLAISAAHALDPLRTKATRPDAPQLLQADQLADALKVDMKEWSTPTAARFFSRISRTCILEALSEAAGKPPARF